MPNIKSAIKRVKVTEKKNLRNRMIKSAMKTQIKKFETAVSANGADAKLLSATQGAVDKAAAKGVIHKNAANRKRLAWRSVLPKLRRKVTHSKSFSHGLSGCGEQRGARGVTR